MSKKSSRSSSDTSNTSIVNKGGTLVVESVAASIVMTGCHDQDDVDTSASSSGDELNGPLGHQLSNSISADVKNTSYFLPTNSQFTENPDSRKNSKLTVEACDVTHYNFLKHGQNNKLKEISTGATSKTCCSNDKEESENIPFCNGLQQRSRSRPVSAHDEELADLAVNHLHDAETIYSDKKRIMTDSAAKIFKEECNKTFDIANKCTQRIMSREDEQLALRHNLRFNPFNSVSDAEDSIVSVSLDTGHAKSDSDSCNGEEDLVFISEDHFSLPEGYLSENTIEELQNSIEKVKEFILMSPEHSQRRRSLVQQLVQLRLKLAKLKENSTEEPPGVKSILGHKFIKRTSQSSKHYCEKCNGVIWGMLQSWYRCTDCGYTSHSKCLNHTLRTCANSKLSENATYNLSVCPEVGLAMQKYRCLECQTEISFKEGYYEARLCDYSGSWYCEQCHWNDVMVIPARVLHNWDFEPRKVCRASKQFLRLTLKRPIIKLQDANPMLFGFVEELNEIRRLREEILFMKKYFLSCTAALESKLLLQLKSRQHFVDNSDMYSLQDLIHTKEDLLLHELKRIHEAFAEHIAKKCKLCQAKGFICELCDSAEVLFPFFTHAIICPQCSTVLHRRCFARTKYTCPKCARKGKRGEASPT